MYSWGRYVVIWHKFMLSLFVGIASSSEAYPISDKLLVTQNDAWYIKENGSFLLKIAYRVENSFENSQFMYAQTGNGKRYKFDNPPETFRKYWRALPEVSRKNDNARLTRGGGEWHVISKVKNENFADFVRIGDDFGYQTRFVIAQASDNHWYTFVDPPRDFIWWLSNMPTFGENKTEKCDNNRLISTGVHSWFMRDDKGYAKRIVAQSKTQLNRDNISYVKCENGRWFKLKNPPAKLTSFLSELPSFEYIDRKVLSTLKETELSRQRMVRLHNNLGNATRRSDERICDHLLQQIDRSWYVVDTGGMPRKVVVQGDNMGHCKYLYSRADDGKWYRFYNPPYDFKEYLYSLPSAGRLNDTDLLVSVPDRGWSVRSKLTGQIKKLVCKGTDKGFGDTSILYARDEDGVWYTFVGAPKIFRFWISSVLPHHNDVPKLQWDNTKLLASEYGGMWKIRENDNNIWHIVSLGNTPWCNRKKMYFVFCDNKKWYKFKNPPKLFANFVARIPLHSIQTVSVQ